MQIHTVISAVVCALYILVVKAEVVSYPPASSI